MTIQIKTARTWKGEKRIAVMVKGPMKITVTEEELRELLPRVQALVDWVDTIREPTYGPGTPKAEANLARRIKAYAKAFK